MLSFERDKLKGVFLHGLSAHSDWHETASIRNNSKLYKPLQNHDVRFCTLEYLNIS